MDRLYAVRTSHARHGSATDDRANPHMRLRQLAADRPVSAEITMGKRVGGLLLASRFVFVTAAFSSGTNDSARLRVRSIVLLLTFVTICLGVVGPGATSLFLPRQDVAWVLWGAAGLLSISLFWIIRLVLQCRSVRPDEHPEKVIRQQ